MSQNLVSNPSLVDLDSCSEYSYTRIHEVTNWFSTFYNQNSIDSLGSTDYFSNCNSQNIIGGIPINFSGYQDIRLLTNYGGFCIYDVTVLGGEYREGIQNLLIEPLKKDSIYKVQFYLSLSNDSYVAINRVELKFSSSRYLSSNLVHDIGATPDLVITNTFFLDDTLNWMKVQGEYVANGGEQWLSIGNFSSNYTFDTIQVNQSGGMSYYYIDDASLYLKSTPVFQADAGTDKVTCAENEVLLSTIERENYFYFWLNLDGDTLSTTAQLTVSPMQTTTYILSQWDFKFDQTWDTVTVYVEPNCPELWLPTWLNPTQSQYWRPHTRDIEWMELTIYNTLGQVIQRYAGHPDNYGGWDGFAIAQGVYYATVNARAYNGEQLKAVEKVMVIRQ